MFLFSFAALPNVFPICGCIEMLSSYAAAAARIAQCAQYPFKHTTFDDDTQIILFWFDLMYNGSDMDYLTSLLSVFSDLTGF